MVRRKTTLRKQDIIREGYVRGLKDAYKLILKQINESEGDNSKCDVRTATVELRRALNAAVTEEYYRKKIGHYIAQMRDAIKEVGIVDSRPVQNIIEKISNVMYQVANSTKLMKNFDEALTNYGKAIEDCSND